MDATMDAAMDDLLALVHHGRRRGQTTTRPAPPPLCELLKRNEHSVGDVGGVEVNWLLALRAFCEDDAALAAQLHRTLIVGQCTNFFFHADGLVGLAIADTKTTRLLVDQFMPSYKLRIVFTQYESSVERLGFAQFVGFVANSSSAPLRWWGGLDVCPVVVGPAIRAAFAVPEQRSFRESSVL